MSQYKTSYSAKFINYEILNNDLRYRRLNFTEVRNSSGDIVKNCLCVDESESLKIIGHLDKGYIVGFTASIVDLTNIEFLYPYALYKEK